MNIISLGAGVQSSTMALMAAHGEITPMPDCAIFADTQAEPKAVMEWLGWLETKLPFPVYRVTAGSLKNESLTMRHSKDGDGSYVRNVVPAFTINPDGTKGMLLRKCTADYKIAPLARKQRALMKNAGLKSLTSWIGISLDEAHRMKPSRKAWMDNRYPLIELEMSRLHCLEWMQRRGYPKPPRSACVYCPFHSDDEWLRLKTEEPQEFDRAVAFEKKYQAAAAQTRLDKIPFLNNRRIPLDTIKFEAGKNSELFGNECEGMCGV